MVRHDLSLKDYFLTVHKLISRGVEISIAKIDEYIQEGFPKESIQAGYLDYLYSLSLLFDSHHKTEDDIAFPYFRASLPETHFEWLFEDHDLITGFLEELEPIRMALENKQEVHSNLVLCREVLLKISVRWDDHIGLEEKEFIRLIDDLSDDEERSKLFDQFGAYNHQLLQPHTLTFPFMLYNLEPEDRRMIRNAYPQDWFDQIDTPEWKQKWESMVPFLWID